MRTSAGATAGSAAGHPRRATRIAVGTVASLAVVASTVAACVTVGDGRPVRGTGDVALVQELLRQRQQFVDLAELIDVRSTSPALQRLGTEIRADADPQLDRMQDLLWRWQADATGQDHAAHRDERAADAPAGAAPGGPRSACILPAARLDQLLSNHGTAFDRAVVATLVDHTLSSTAALAARADDPGATLGRDAEAVRRDADRALADLLDDLLQLRRTFER